VRHIISGQGYAIGVNNNTAMQIMRQDWKPGVGAQDGKGRAPAAGNPCVKWVKHSLI